MMKNKDTLNEYFRNKKKLISHLNGLSSGSVKPKDPYQGVCNELSEYIMNDLILETLTLMRLWPNSSGLKGYPVCHPKLSAQAAYYSKGLKHWTGDYGNNRKSLCKWLSTELSKSLKKQELQNDSQDN